VVPEEFCGEVGPAVPPVTEISELGSSIEISIVELESDESRISSTTYTQRDDVVLTLTVVPEKEETPLGPEKPFVSVDPNCDSPPTYVSLEQS
jgi:hypothetical protein